LTTTLKKEKEHWPVSLTVIDANVLSETLAQKSNCPLKRSLALISGIYPWDARWVSIYKSVAMTQPISGRKDKNHLTVFCAEMAFDTSQPPSILP
jgi:hypothetical protein